VKVGHRQAVIPKTPAHAVRGFFYARKKITGILVFCPDWNAAGHR